MHFCVFFSKNICKYQNIVVPLHPLLLNGVMVALQILVLSVWVRVLVEQHEKSLQLGTFFCSYRLKPRVLSPLRYERLLSMRVLVEQLDERGH